MQAVAALDSSYVTLFNHSTRLKHTTAKSTLKYWLQYISNAQDTD